jgi:hypothetical protein
MESEEIREALREAERAEAAPWTDYRRTSWWFAPAAGAWAGLVVLLLWLDDHLFWVANLFWIIGANWWQRRRGVVPRGLSPREQWRPAAIWVALLLASAGIAYVVWRQVDPRVAAAVTAVLVTISYAWYDRAYARAAERTRARLG